MRSATCGGGRDAYPYRDPLARGGGQSHPTALGCDRLRADLREQAGSFRSPGDQASDTGRALDRHDEFVRDLPAAELPDVTGAIGAGKVHRGGRGAIEDVDVALREFPIDQPIGRRDHGATRRSGVSIVAPRRPSPATGPRLAEARGAGAFVRVPSSGRAASGRVWRRPDAPALGSAATHSARSRPPSCIYNRRSAPDFTGITSVRARPVHAATGKCRILQTSTS